jgi:tyrosine-protein phosphatase YwqE
MKDKMKEKANSGELSGQEFYIQPAIVYEIDFEKINTLEDIKYLLQGLDIKFHQHYKNIEKIKHLLIEVK